MEHQNEGQLFDRKSLKLITGKNSDWNELAKDCVAFANAKGGSIAIGIEDALSLPAINQKIEDNLPGKVHLRMSQLTVNTAIFANKIVATNGGEYIDLQILPSGSTIAGTVDGKYYIRINDESCPLLPDQMLRLLTDKPSYIWETRIVKNARKNACDADKLDKFISDIRSSERVSKFVKDKTTDELLEYYFMSEGEFLTNLGVLWIGKRSDRAKLVYSPVVQFIKYDERDIKVNKIVWDDYSLNPKELIEAIWAQIPDWKEGIEVSNGIFRKFIPNYGERTVRELITNAIVHRPYTTAGDIFINLFPDRLEIHNPGTFPIGVTPKNILRTTQRRNDKLCQVAYDMLLMEREGSGYDTIYEDLLSNGKPLPVPEELDDRVKVTIRKSITKPEIIGLINRIDEEYQLNQKELIAFGLIAQHQSISALELSKTLDLQGNNPTRPWIDRLLELGIIKQQGRTKGVEYYVNSDIIRQTKFKRKTSLKVIEPHRLKELIYADLKMYPYSSLTDINRRIGEEITRNKIKSQIDSLISEKRVALSGKTRGAKYSINTNGGE